jgi:hypothetical protein
VIRPAGIAGGSLDTETIIGKVVEVYSSGSPLILTSTVCNSTDQTESIPAAWSPHAVGKEIRSETASDYAAFWQKSYLAIGSGGPGAWQQGTLQDTLGFAAIITGALTGYPREYITQIDPGPTYLTEYRDPVSATGVVYLIEEAFDPYLVTGSNLPTLGTRYISLSLSGPISSGGTTACEMQVLETAALPPIYGFATIATAPLTMKSVALTSSIYGFLPY